MESEMINFGTSHAGRPGTFFKEQAFGAHVVSAGGFFAGFSCMLSGSSRRHDRDREKHLLALQNEIGVNAYATAFRPFSIRSLASLA